MPFDYSSARSVDPLGNAAAKEKRLVHIQELFGPKLVLVEDICRGELGGDASCKVFDTLAASDQRNSQAADYERTRQSHPRSP